MNGSRTEDAFSRFELLERRADFAEGRADALGMTGPKSLEEEIAELKAGRKGRRRTGSHESRAASGQGGLISIWKISSIPLIVVPILFIGLPWLIFHYITKWKQAATLTQSDEKLLDELHDAARRLDDRLCIIERIMTAENPNWRQQCCPAATPAPAGGRRIDDGRPDAQRPVLGPSSRRAAPASTATSATARSWASAPESPIIPASTSTWCGCAWSPRCS